MIIFDSEMKEYLDLFEKTFNDVVPLRQISFAATNEQLINAIKQSVEQNENLLPQIFGYGKSKTKVY